MSAGKEGNALNIQQYVYIYIDEKYNKKKIYH